MSDLVAVNKTAGVSSSGETIESVSGMRIWFCTGQGINQPDCRRAETGDRRQETGDSISWELGVNIGLVPFNPRFFLGTGHISSYQAR